MIPLIYTGIAITTLGRHYVIIAANEYNSHFDVEHFIVSEYSNGDLDFFHPPLSNHGKSLNSTNTLDNILSSEIELCKSQVYISNCANLEKEEITTIFSELKYRLPNVLTQISNETKNKHLKKLIDNWK